MKNKKYKYRYLIIFENTISKTLCSFNCRSNNPDEAIQSVIKECFNGPDSICASFKINETKIEFKWRNLKLLKIIKFELDENKELELTRGKISKEYYDKERENED